MPDQTIDTTAPPMWTKLLDTARSLARTGAADEIGELMCEAYTVGVTTGQQRQFERLLTQIDELRAQLVDEQAAHAKTISNFDEFAESIQEQRGGGGLGSSRRAQDSDGELPQELLDAVAERVQSQRADAAHKLAQTAYRLGSIHRAAPQDLPAEWELALLRQANAEDGLDVADDELLDHARTQTYRVLLRAAYRACHAAGLGYEVTVGELGDRLHIGDRVPNTTPPVSIERPVDLNFGLPTPPPLAFPAGPR